MILIKHQTFIQIQQQIYEMKSNLGEVKSMKLKIVFQLRFKKRELISKNISKYIASLDYFDKSLNVLSILSGNISIMLARSKLNSIKSKISKALMDNEISHEDFETIINIEN